MVALLTVMHVLFCLFLILAILLQTGKGGGMGAAFGGGGSSTVFGPRGAGSFIGKLTGVVATLFMVSSLALAYISSSQGTGVADKAALAETLAEQAEDVGLDEARRIAGSPDPVQEAAAEPPEPIPTPEATPDEGGDVDRALGEAPRPDEPHEDPEQGE